MVPRSPAFRHRARCAPRGGLSATGVLLVLAIAVVAVLLLVVLSRRPVESGHATPRGAGAFPSGPKPRPAATGFRECPPRGDGGDPALNFLKNRTDSAAWAPVPFDSVESLPWPPAVERRRRSAWSRSDADAVARYEGLPVALEGFLAGAKQEGPETPNCHGADAEFRDWHMWLVAEPTRDRSGSIVVETTPVIRAQHPAWTLAAMRRLVRERTPVRVSGWLLLDPEHPDQVGKTRGTIWEIHPIMRIEVKQMGRWVPLD